MKRLFSILFILVYLSVLLKPSIPLLDYIINYNYIKTVLCVNKDKPEMNCNGQCHLKQMIKKETQEENNQNPKIPNIEISKIQLFFADENLNLKIEERFLKCKPIYKTSLTSQLFSPRIFRPPAFA